MEYLEKVGLAQWANHLPNELSGGQKQRVAIARAIVNRPRIIFADEPTGNLDDLSARGILSLFKKLRDEYNICLIVVTHDPRIVALADGHYHLEDAHLVKKKDRFRVPEGKTPPKGKTALKKVRVKKTAPTTSGDLRSVVKSKMKTRKR